MRRVFAESSPSSADRLSARLAGENSKERTKKKGRNRGLQLGIAQKLAQHLFRREVFCGDLACSTSMGSIITVNSCESGQRFIGSRERKQTTSSRNIVLEPGRFSHHWFLRREVTHAAIAKPATISSRHDIFRDGEFCSCTANVLMVAIHIARNGRGTRQLPSATLKSCQFCCVIDL